MTPAVGELPLVTPSSPSAPPLPGGTSGILPQNAKMMQGASAKIHFPPDTRQVPHAVAPENDVKVKRFVVQNCPKPINGSPAGFRYVKNGVIAWLVDGKVVDETLYDLADLRRQGVDLKEIGEV
jgi:hypothetical protein